MPKLFLTPVRWCLLNQKPTTAQWLLVQYACNKFVLREREAETARFPASGQDPVQEESFRRLFGASVLQREEAEVSGSAVYLQMQSRAQSISREMTQ